jgi:hypothetical protein
MRPLRRIRLSTFLILILLVALLVGMFVQERQMRAVGIQLAPYRDPTSEPILDFLDEPLALEYPDQAPLEVILKEIRRRSTGVTKLKTGIPIYVDPIGLQEAELSMTSPVTRPQSAVALKLGDHIEQALAPMGLGYTVKYGFLMVTSKDSLDKDGEDSLMDAYRQYRDVLK